MLRLSLQSGGENSGASQVAPAVFVLEVWLRAELSRAGGREALSMARRRELLLPMVIGLAVLLATVVAIAGAAPAKRQGQGKGPKRPTAAWRDDFEGTELDASRWIIATGQAPGHILNYHIGYYEPDNVSVGGGFLTLRLTQTLGPVDARYGTNSHGALVYTNGTYGYGTYEWRMRMSSTATAPDEPGDPVSGSVSAGFIYVNNSETEIDFEFSGLNPETLYMVNWKNTNPSTDPTSSQSTVSTLYPFTVTDEFHTYRFVWERKKISFFVDGALKAVHTTDVPRAPAYFMINHWGTDSPYWGGTARPGDTRYFYVDWVSYSPL